MTERNNSPAPLPAEVAQMVAGVAQCLVARDMHYEADMLTALATQLAERDALWMERQREDLHAIDLSIATNKRLRARIAALTEALRTIHTRAISTRGDQAYREFPRFAEKASRAALTADKEPTT